MKVGTRGFGRYGECRVVAVQDDGALVQVQYGDGEVRTVQNDGRCFVESLQESLALPTERRDG